MKSQLKKLKGCSVKLEKFQVALKDFFRLEESQFDQLYFTCNISDSIIKIYDLQTEISMLRYNNEVDNFHEKKLASLALCSLWQQFKIKKRTYGLIILSNVVNGTSLADRNNNFSNQQLNSLALFLIKTLQQLKKKKITFCNIRPENIYYRNNVFSLINSEYIVTNRSRQKIGDFFWEVVEKDHTYWAPEILDNYSNKPICYVSDMFSVGCLLYTLKYGKYPFQSRFAAINSSYKMEKDDSIVSDLIEKFLDSFETRQACNLQLFEENLQKIVAEQIEKQKEIKNQELANKKTANSGTSFFDDITAVFNKMKSDSEGWFLNYVQDHEREPIDKYMENILIKIYKNEEKGTKLTNIIQKFIEFNEQKKNSILKTLLLIGNIFRKGPTYVYSSFESVLNSILAKTRDTQQIKEFTEVLIEKCKLNQHLKKCLYGNFYLSEVTSFKSLTISDLKQMTFYLEKVVSLLKKRISEKSSGLNETIISFLCDQIYSLISMIIIFIICIRKDNELQLRNDALRELMPIEKILNFSLKKISDISSFVAAHAIYSIQPEYVSYQEEVYLVQNPYYTTLEHFYRSCRYYKGLSIPQDYNRIYLKQERKIEVRDSLPAKVPQQKSPEIRSKSYFNEVLSDQEDFELKAPKRSNEGHKNANFFQEFGKINQNQKTEKISQKKDNSTNSVKNIEKKSQSNEPKIKQSDSRPKHKKIDFELKTSKMKNKNEKEKSTISFEQFGKMIKQQPKSPQLVDEFSIFNQIKDKPRKVEQKKNQLNKSQKKIPPKPPKAPNTFEQFDNLFIKQTKTKKIIQNHENKSQKKIQKIEEKFDFEESNPFAKDLFPIEVNPRVSQILKGLKLKELKDLLKKNESFIINFSQLSFLKVIGCGSAGDVYLGTYKGQEIAIKKVKAKQNPNALKQFERELVTYIKIKKNPYLVSLIGLSEDKGDFYLMTQFCEAGSLFDLLHKKVAQIPLSWLQKIQFAYEIAEGMKQLHEMRPAIIHRDLKSLNVFVTKKEEKWRMKVADFGLSRSPEAEMMTTQLGTIHWMAPQLLEGKQYSAKVDVYSYGVLLWEILARKTPYSDLQSPMAILKHVAIDKKRPSLEVIGMDCPPDLTNLMKRCWDHEATERPDFKQIISSLKQIKSKFVC